MSIWNNVCIVYENEAGKHLSTVCLFISKLLFFLSTRIKFINSGKYRVRHFLAIKRVSRSHLENLSAPIWKSTALNPKNFMWKSTNISLGKGKLKFRWKPLTLSVVLGFVSLGTPKHTNSLSRCSAVNTELRERICYFPWLVPIPSFFLVLVYYLWDLQKHRY